MAITSGTRTGAHVGRRPAATRTPMPRRGWKNLARDHGYVIAVIATYLLACLVVPVLTPVSISDDWTYTRSVEILIREGRFQILDIAGASALFQILWAAPLAALFGPTFGVLRLATVLFIAGSSVAVYAGCRELNVVRERGALACALYLFNPLLFSLSYTFMSDPYFTGLLSLCSYAYLRALRSRNGVSVSWPWLLGASGIAALAFLQRAHGVLIPLSVAAFLLLSRNLRFDQRSLRLLLGVGGIPLGVAVAFAVFATTLGGPSTAQQAFAGSVIDAGVSDTLLLIQRLAFIAIMYSGLFVLPLAVALVPHARAMFGGLTPRGWVTCGLWYSAVLVGFTAFISGGRLMPYVPHFISRAGLGPDDLVISRGHLLTDGTALALTILCAAAVLILVVACTRGWTLAPQQRGVAVLLALGGGQAIGVLLPSFAFRNWEVGGVSAPSLDRYLLPLLPFVIWLGLWGLREMRIVRELAWGCVALVALFCVIGTRDALVFQQATWELAARANELGVENTRLDAGFSWDAYHLYEFSVSTASPVMTPGPAPWWITGFAQATDSSYVITTSGHPGYRLVEEVEYSSWLDPRRTVLQLLARPDVTTTP